MFLPCPSDAEVSAAIAALRPRGDAWRNGDADDLAGSVMGRVFDAFGTAIGPVHRRFCALVDEYFCSSAVETRDIWAAEYGVPDGCDPFADVCEKVQAVGDTTAAYVIAAALKRGWSITIREEFIVAGEDCAVGWGLSGIMVCGAQNGVAWFVTVDRAASPAYAAPNATPPLAGLMLAGLSLACDPDIEPLKCLVRRIAPAHADLSFTAIN